MASPVQTQPMAEAGAKLLFHDGCIGLHPCEVYSNSNTAVGKNLANSFAKKTHVAFFFPSIYFGKKKLVVQDFFHQAYVYTYESWVCIVCRFGSTNRTKQLIQYYVCLISVIIIIPPSKVSRIDSAALTGTVLVYIRFWCIYPDILCQFISFTI